MEDFKNIYGRVSCVVAIFIHFESLTILFTENSHETNFFVESISSKILDLINKIESLSQFMIAKIK